MTLTMEMFFGKEERNLIKMGCYKENIMCSFASNTSSFIFAYAG